MRVSSSSLLAVAASVFFDAEVQAQPANPTPFQQRVIAAMQGDIRTPEERAREDGLRGLQRSGVGRPRRGVLHRLATAVAELDRPAPGGAVLRVHHQA